MLNLVLNFNTSSVKVLVVFLEQDEMTGLFFAMYITDLEEHFYVKDFKGVDKKFKLYF